VRHIPIEEMFTTDELMNLRTAFEAVSMGEAFINLDALKALFEDMQADYSDEQLTEFLELCGKSEDEDFISFELFARTLALMLEDKADKVSTSSQQNDDQGEEYGEEETESQA